MTNDTSFIEVQFPVSKVSKECYKEREAGNSQTLTGLGKWWGRKPLFLVRATILGILMPASNDPIKDRDIFLKALMMDEHGLRSRKNKTIKDDIIQSHLTENEIENYKDELEKNLRTTKIVREEIQYKVFDRLTYDDKLEYCLRTEETKISSDDTWKEINSHLDTTATKISELIQQLGIKKFGKIPTVGDCFSGGGSIPYESARLGCNVYASDLNPLASLLTWSNLNILSLDDKEIEGLKIFQEKVFDKVADKIEELGIEKNEKGWIAKYFLYCMETICPECGTKVPMAPSWIISKRKSTVALLKYNNENRNFDIDIIQDANKEIINKAQSLITAKNNSLYCPKCTKSTPITVIRRDRYSETGDIVSGLREWKKGDFIPLDSDIFQERLYCIKYLKLKEGKAKNDFIKKPGPATDASYGTSYFCSPTKKELDDEYKIITILKENINQWQLKGYIPSLEINEGYNTTQPIRERGWKFWHHLFNSRQLLVQALFYEAIESLASNNLEKVLGVLGVNKLADFNSKLCRWHSRNSQTAQTFYNQALNTLDNFAGRGMSANYIIWKTDLNNYPFTPQFKIETKDARKIDSVSDIWITDPPYADAVNYHELTEFFLAWDKVFINDLFNDWYTESKRVLAVKGTGESFNKSMIQIYENLAKHMPDNGVQVVMFTHQDPAVWADLTLVLWSSGLQVTAAWNIATETEAGGLKDGNYVKGTVLLVLRKLTSNETAYMDELYPEIEHEVKSQIDNMRDLDDKEDPNFTDADYLLAAYAASLKVLTSYQKIGDINIEYELSKTRSKGETSPVEEIITQAIKIAYDYLIPAGFDSFIWKNLSASERFYIKGIELEKNGIYQISAYQELGRGFGIKDYKNLLASTKANEVRLKSAMEFGNKNINTSDEFSSTTLRHVLMAIHQSIKTEDTNQGKNWLKNELEGKYWGNRNTILALLEYLGTVSHIKGMENRQVEAEHTKYIAELVKNDGI